MSLGVIIYAANEYPETIHLDYPEYKKWQVVRVTSIQLEGVRLYFDSEIIAVTDDVISTLWLNPSWINSPYTTQELLPAYPLKSD